jgi:hypothetical protein
MSKPDLWAEARESAERARAKAKVPSVSLLSRDFDYVDAAKTNLQERFARIKAEQNKQQKQVRRVK